MSKLIFNYCNLIFLYYLLCFFSYVYCKDGDQDINHTPMDVDPLLKHLEDKANQQIVKDKMCAQANIVCLNSVPEDNVIKVIFKLQDKKFQDCFKYFKIIVEKKRKVIKEVKVPYLYDRQEEISYRFMNISCGIYDVFVQPCFDDRYCPLFRWLYEKSINVTTNDCILQIKTFLDEDYTRLHIAIILFCILCLCFGTVLYIYLPYKRGVPGYYKVKITSKCDLMEERKCICFIYFFHKYNKGDIMENEINDFKAALESELLSIFHIITQSYLNIQVKTIASELVESMCLDDVDKWLNNALKKTGEDGILQRCILIKSNKEMEEDDNIENEIFAYIQDKVGNNHEDFDNLFIAQSGNLTTYSEELTTQNIQAVISCDSHCSHLLNFCLDICSEFVVPLTRKQCAELYMKNLKAEKRLGAFPNSVNFFRKPLCEIIC